VNSQLRISRLIKIRKVWFYWRKIRSAKSIFKVQMNLILRTQILQTLIIKWISIMMDLRIIVKLIKLNSRTIKTRSKDI